MSSTMPLSYAGSDISAKMLQAINAVMVGAVTSATQVRQVLLILID